MTKRTFAIYAYDPKTELATRINTVEYTSAKSARAARKFAAKEINAVLAIHVSTATCAQPVTLPKGERLWKEIN